jgi:L-asparaginase
MLGVIMKKILIISTGGTFNKIYNPLLGELEIDRHSSALTEIASAWLCELSISNIIGKDSLDMTDKDREFLVQTIQNTPIENIIIIHGTDTIDITATYINKHIHHKKIILTGAMTPFSIEPIEATANLASAYGYLSCLEKYGTFIAMNGIITSYKDISKDRTLGKFVSIKTILS